MNSEAMYRVWDIRKKEMRYGVQLLPLEREHWKILKEDEE